ncbi:hypothetical protein CHS0354_007022 [Potamilus streckersoni]|uniref:Uncharacterized protein n=1 Tax=Potamilus streckersoni TaxID=2493646 RepID=A0AAE0RWJ8_9BIVA|nr:hypothetical protein CHS0354_007022 [Potamilus streckersoni]
MTSDNSTEKKKSLRRVIERFADKCSMQGISYIHAARFWWSRLIWVVLTLSAIGAMTFHFYYIMNQYYEYPVQTTVSLGFNNLQLPGITICNVNVLRNSKLNISNSTDMEELRNIVQGTSEDNVSNSEFYYEDYYDDDVDGDQGAAIERAEKEDGYVQDQRFKKNYMDLRSEDRKNAGHFMEDMIVSCSFAGRECTAKAFKLHQTADYGNCWELNTTNKIATRSGEMAGFTLTLNLQNWEFLESVSEGYGARLVIHQPGTIPLPSSEGIFISSSFETNIGIRMVQVSRLGEPYSKCNDGKKFQERYGVTYTRQSCQFICLTSEVIRICGCIDDNGEELVMMVNGTTRRCENEKDKACYRDVFKEYRNKNISCDCINPCNEYVYIKTISSRPWPTDEYTESLVKAVCNKSNEMCIILKERYTDNRLLSYNFMKLNVYFEDLNFEKIEETPQIAMAQFMSDVGGAIGLWIGLSVLAVCEIFHLIIELCALGIDKCNSKGHTEYVSEGNFEQSINKESRIYERTPNERNNIYMVPINSSDHH